MNDTQTTGSHMSGTLARPRIYSYDHHGTLPNQSASASGWTLEPQGGDDMTRGTKRSLRTIALATIALAEMYRDLRS